MDRIGTHPSGMRQQQEKDMVAPRLTLMIIMARAYLKGYPFGRYRTAAVRNNADRLSAALADWEGHRKHFSTLADKSSGSHLDHILFQRIKLLLVMTASFAGGNPMGAARKKALKNNVDYIAECIHVEHRSDIIPVLSVA